MLRALPALLLLLCACGESDEPPAKLPRKVEKQEPTVAVPAQEAESERVPVEEPAGSPEAASVLKSYYALIEAGKYEQAWKLRENRRGDSSAAFVESFAEYASYRANVGASSEPQEAGGSLYVEVPVQIYGRLKNGQSFGSAGNVTLRRKAGEREWRIHS